jgi:hypothetical protein
VFTPAGVFTFSGNRISSTMKNTFDMTKNHHIHDRITDRLVRLCTSNDSVSALVAQDPSLAPGDAWEKLYGKGAVKDAAGHEENGDNDNESTISESTSQAKLERAASCGKWGPTKPSDLFLRVCMGANEIARGPFCADICRYTMMPCVPLMNTLTELWLAPR